MLDIDLGLRVWAAGERVRLYGINAPELPTSAGRDAAAAVLAWFAAHPGTVWLATMPSKDGDRSEKYGRWLVVIFTSSTFDGPTLNDHLVSAGLAVPYSP